MPSVPGRVSANAAKDSLANSGRVAGRGRGTFERDVNANDSVDRLLLDEPLTHSCDDFILFVCDTGRRACKTLTKSPEIEGELEGPAIATKRANGEGTITRRADRRWEARVTIRLKDGKPAA